uniref:Si:dkey-1j5.4 n=1 Tax=Fundulus heteroclitus TaxID=8078 RepID=A0A3Q2UCP0_FUNHE
MYSKRHTLLFLLLMFFFFFFFTFNSSVKMLPLTQLVLVSLSMVQAVASCPDVCKCSQKPGPEKSEVNCHKKGLRAFPSHLPPDAWILKLGKCLLSNHTILLDISKMYLSLSDIEVFWTKTFSILFQKGENGITEIKANSLRSVPMIESINLERNAIKSIHPKAFAGAKRLMLLNLYGNHITVLPSRGFQDLLNLRFLMLGQNQIGILKAEIFAGMRNLSDLDLSLNALTVLPSNAFKPLIALKVLDLSLNRIQRISPKAFTGLRQLLFLNLDNNSNMPKLSQLGLSGNRLKTVDGNMFSHMPG